MSRPRVNFQDDLYSRVARTAETPRITHVERNPFDLSAKFRDSEFLSGRFRRDVRYTDLNFAWCQVHVCTRVRVSLASVCPSRKFRKLIVQTAEEKESVQNLQTTRTAISIKLSHSHANVYRTLSAKCNVSLFLSLSLSLSTMIHVSTITIRSPIDADWHASTQHARVAWNRAERHRLTDWLTDSRLLSSNQAVGCLSDCPVWSEGSRTRELLLLWATRNVRGDAFR